MSKRFVLVRYERCRPNLCSPDAVCPACAVCPSGTLKQIDPAEPPTPVPAGMCRACAKCLEVCPTGAIELADR